MERRAPAQRTGEDVEPPLGGAVAGRVGVEGDEDDRGQRQPGDPGAAAAAAGGTGGHGGDLGAAGLDDGQGVDLALDEDGGGHLTLPGSEGSGVVEGVGETGGADVLGLARGGLTRRERAADVETPGARRRHTRGR